MMSLRKKWIVALTAASVAVGSVAVPAMAQERRSFDPARLDKVQAEYSQYRYRGYYRGGWRGPSRGSAIAAGVGLGILGAAAAAASARSYDPYYDGGYYAAPVYAPPPVYVAPRYYAPYGYYAPYDFRDHR